MKFLESFIMGLVSGLTEFLPISSGAHQQILRAIFGADTPDPTRNLFVHIAVLLAVYTSTSKTREQLNRAHRTRLKRNSSVDSKGKAFMEYQLLRSAALPFLIIFFLFYFFVPIQSNLLTTSLLLLLNGVAIYLPERMLQGNKNAKVISILDAMFIGVAGALDAFPGFSRIGCMISAAAIRGAEKRTSVIWALLLSIPALIAWICADVITLFSKAGLPFWSNFIFYLIAGISAYIGSCGGIYVLRKHIRLQGCAAYAYYCWGAALLSLILFLTVV